MPGRTDNDVKNYWNTKLKKRLNNASTGPAQQTPIPSASASAVTPFLPLPPLSSIKAEAFDWAAFGFGHDLQSDLPPFTAPAAAKVTANTTPENSSAASSSVENWSASGRGGADDPFLSELGFESYSEFLAGGAYAEVGQVYSSSSVPELEGMYQRINY